MITLTTPPSNEALKKPQKEAPWKISFFYLLKEIYNKRTVKQLYFHWRLSKNVNAWDVKKIPFLFLWLITCYLNAYIWYSNDNNHPTFQIIQDILLVSQLFENTHYLRMTFLVPFVRKISQIFLTLKNREMWK